MTFQIQDYPWASGPGASNVIPQAGTQAGMLADGTVEAYITFPFAYPTTVASVNATAGGTGVSPISCNVVDGSVTTASFKVYVSGAALGTTVDVYWTSQGS